MAGTPSTAIGDLRPDLGGSMEAFDVVLERSNYIGYQILRPFEASRQSGPYGKITLEAMLQNPEVKRASDGGYSRRQWSFEDANYATKEYGLESAIDQRRSRIYRSYFDAELVTARIVLADVLRAAEIRIADKVFDAATFSPTAVGVAWSTPATAVPITDVKSKIEAIWGACGLWPNAVVMSRKVFRNLRECAQVIERIHATGAGDKVRAKDITPAQIAALFDVDFVLIGGGAKNTAKEGQTAVIAEIWDDEYVGIGRIATTDMIEEPCIGRTFHWAEDGSQIGGAIETYGESRVRGDVVRVRHEVDEHIIHAPCWGLLSNITA